MQQTDYIPHIQTSGQGEEVLVLLHGFLEDSRMWEDSIRVFEKDFTVIRMDFPGHGLSPDLPSEKADYSMEAMAERVNQFGVAQHKKIHLLGHSMGGYVALAFAEKYPEKLASLSLFFSTPLADSTEKKQQRAKAAELAMQNPEAFVRAAIPLLFHIQNPTAKQKALEQAFRATSKSIAAYLHAMAQRPERTCVLEELTVPTAIWSGEYDQAAPPEAFASRLQKIKHIQHKTYPCGHMGHYEIPRILEKEVYDFLKKSK